MQLLADIKFTLYKTGSEYVPYKIESLEVNNHYHQCYPIEEDIKLIEVELIDLPEGVKNMEINCAAEISAEFWGEWSAGDSFNDPDAFFELRETKFKIKEIE